MCCNSDDYRLKGHKFKTDKDMWGVLGGRVWSRNDVYPISL